MASGLLLDEGNYEILVHPEAHIESRVQVVLSADKGMSAAWIVVKACWNAALFQSCLVEVRSMWSYSQVRIADKELGRCAHVLDVCHGRALIEVHLVLDCDCSKVELLATTAGEDPVRDV